MQGMNTDLTYRPDIDGMRTIAILPVLFFHYGYSVFSGGFVGVDVFFVISGFLITSIIASEIAAGSFTVVRFYERRIRRILPALICVIVMVIVLSSVLLSPHDMSRLGAELWHSSIFSTNYLFYKKDGYFDGVSTMRLLLHTWSLSIEEQFYVIMPILMILASRVSAQLLKMAVFSLFLLSLALSIFSVFSFPSSAFYLLPARAWELMCGSLLALGAIPTSSDRRIRESVAIVGVILLATAIFTFTSTTPFPGAAAGLPCFGIAMVIWASSGQAPTLVSRALSLGPMVAIGKISYSLYLWHWPLLVMSKYYLLRELTTSESVVAIALAFALSILTYIYVEQPFRRKRVLSSRRPLFGLAGAVLASIFVFGMFAKETGGFPSRFNDEALHYATFAGSIDPRREKCMNPTPAQIHDEDVCNYGFSQKPHPDFVVWGDSQLGAAMPLFSALADEHGLRGFHLSVEGCPPLLGVWIKNSERGQPYCPDYSEAALDLMIRDSVKAVILVARWPMYAEKFPRIGIDAQANVPMFVLDKETAEPEDGASKSVLKRWIQRTFLRLKENGIRVYVMEPVPEALVDVPNALVANTILKRSTDRLAPSRGFTEERQKWINDRFAEAEAQGLITIVRTHQTFCDEERCAIEADGVPLYRDSNHLSIPGAMQMKTIFTPVFRQIAQLKTAERR